MSQPEKNQENMAVHPAERRLIEYIRSLRFGRLEIKVHQGLPMEVERSVEKIRLTIDDQ